MKKLAIGGNKMKTLLLTTVFVLIPTFALAQSIETGQLSEAKAFDAGVIDARSGGLDTLVARHIGSNGSPPDEETSAVFR